MKVKFKKREQTTKVILVSAQDDKGSRQLNMEARSGGSLHHGYHYVIRSDGTVEEGRAHDAVSSFRDKTAIYVRENHMCPPPPPSLVFDEWAGLEFVKMKEEDIG